MILLDAIDDMLLKILIRRSVSCPTSDDAFGEATKSRTPGACHFGRRQRDCASALPNPLRRRAGGTLEGIHHRGSWCSGVARRLPLLSDAQIACVYTHSPAFFLSVMNSRTTQFNGGDRATEGKLDKLKNIEQILFFYERKSSKYIVTMTIDIQI